MHLKSRGVNAIFSWRVLSENCAVWIVLFEDGVQKIFLLGYSFVNGRGDRQCFWRRQIGKQRIEQFSYISYKGEPVLLW